MDMRMRAFSVLAAVAFLGTLQAPLQAQGCVCARQGAPVIGSQGGTYMGGGQWQLFTGYRYFKSDRHFIGRQEQHERQTEQSEVINWVHQMDLAVTYAFSERLNLTFSAPFLFADRSNPIRSGGVVVDRTRTSANGIGDVSVLARGWVLSPEEHAEGNVAVGLGLKLPTGEAGATDTFKTLTGQQVRTVDQSIQPGDGGVGMVLETQMFRRIWKATVSVQGVYLFNPRETNGVRTFRNRPSEAIMSVADQYLLRVGAAVPVLPEKGLSMSVAWRIEGVPATDLIGGSEGFRRPGYAASIEPGIAWGYGQHSFAVSAPMVVSRNRTRSVSDILVGGHGDAAFADFQILAGYAIRF